MEAERRPEELRYRPIDFIKVLQEEEDYDEVLTIIRRLFEDAKLSGITHNLHFVLRNGSISL